MTIVLAGLLTAVLLLGSNVAAQPLEQIAYLGEGGSVWLTDVESGETVQLASAQGFTAFGWAPDGQRLALVKGGRTGGENQEIYIVDVDSGDPIKVADGYAPTWSSDGERILYAGNFIAGEEVGVVTLPAEFAMSNAYPNPFNPATTFTVALPDAADLNVIVYNVTGQQVAELTTGQHPAGTHSFVFDATGLASGLYFVRASVPGHLDQVQKVMLVR